MCKIDLKDTYFAVALAKGSQKYVRFQWKGSLYKFLWLCFSLSSAPRVYTKLMKVPISLLRQFCIKIIIRHLIGASTDEVLTTWGTIIYLPQNRGFPINILKSVLNSVSTLEFLGVLSGYNIEPAKRESEKRYTNRFCRQILSQPFPSRH